MAAARRLSRWTWHTIALAAALIAFAPLPALAQETSTGAKQRITYLTGTEEVALGQPRVQIQLRQGERILSAEAPFNPLDLEGDNRRQTSLTAYLDTGASGCVLSAAAADRFGVQREPEAAFHEVGLHGATLVDVAKPLDILMQVSSSKPRKGEDARDLFAPVLKAARFQISREKPDPLLQLAGGEMNIVGMPVIRSLLVEIDPAPLRGLRGETALLNDGPRMVLHDKGSRMSNVDFTISLEPIDFSRRKHPDNNGPLPSLATNPVVPAVQSSAGSASFTCDWLLDTGAAASIISTRHATALGLLNADGTPARPPDFTLPLGGVGGGGTVRSAPGYVIDGLRIKARNDRLLELRRVHIIVRDISTTLDDGRTITLDGVLGMNLLLPSASGVTDGVPDKLSDGPFDRIWIDGGRNTLGLTLKAAR